MSLFSLGCLGLIVALLGTAVLVPLLLVTGNSSQIQGPVYQDQVTSIAITVEAFPVTPVPTWEPTATLAAQ